MSGYSNGYGLNKADKNRIVIDDSPVFPLTSFKTTVQSECGRDLSTTVPQRNCAVIADMPKDSADYHLNINEIIRSRIILNSNNGNPIKATSDLTIGEI